MDSIRKLPRIMIGHLMQSLCALRSRSPRLPHPYCNQSLSAKLRVKDLLSRLTYEEKAASLDTSNPGTKRLHQAVDLP